MKHKLSTTCSCCVCFMNVSYCLSIGNQYPCFCLDRKIKRKTKPRPGQDPGSDPDLVSTGQLPEQALKAVGVRPGTKHEGSVQSLLKGKEDIELAGVALTKEQVLNVL